MLTASSRRAPRTVGLAAAALLLAGCAGQADPEESASTGSPSATSAAATETTAASAGEEPAVETTSFPADTSPDVAEAVSPEGLVVTEVRAGRHEGFDRVVLELAGTGTPGWRVEYVEAAAAPGSGDAVDVPGSAVLQVEVVGTSYPYETDAEEVARGPVSVSGTESVQGVVYGATYEGSSVAWIGTGAATPFRVYALESPTRVVVEVADAG